MSAQERFALPCHDRQAKLHLARPEVSPLHLVAAGQNRIALLRGPPERRALELRVGRRDARLQQRDVGPERAQYSWSVKTCVCLRLRYESKAHSVITTSQADEGVLAIGPCAL